MLNISSKRDNLSIIQKTSVKKNIQLFKGAEKDTNEQ